MPRNLFVIGAIAFQEKAEVRKILRESGHAPFDFDKPTSVATQEEITSLLTWATAVRNILEEQAIQVPQCFTQISQQYLQQEGVALRTRAFPTDTTLKTIIVQHTVITMRPDLPANWSAVDPSLMCNRPEEINRLNALLDWRGNSCALDLWIQIQLNNKTWALSVDALTETRIQSLGMKRCELFARELLRGQWAGVSGDQRNNFRDHLRREIHADEMREMRARSLNRPPRFPVVGPMAYPELFAFLSANIPSQTAAVVLRALSCCDGIAHFDAADITTESIIEFENNGAENFVEQLERLFRHPLPQQPVPDEQRQRQCTRGETCRHQWGYYRVFLNGMPVTLNLGFYTEVTMQAAVGPMDMLEPLQPMVFHYLQAEQNNGTGPYYISSHEAAFYVRNLGLTRGESGQDKHFWGRHYDPVDECIVEIDDRTPDLQGGDMPDLAVGRREVMTGWTFDEEEYDTRVMGVTLRQCDPVQN